MKTLPPIENEVSDETGQFDPRFLLWRQFCNEHGIPVESLPSQLGIELKREWEKFKTVGPSAKLVITDRSPLPPER